jgi:hypothetical protein
MKCVVIAFVVAAAFAVSACDGDDTTAPAFPPEVSITAPDDGSTYDVSDVITFRGAATDPDGGAIDSLVWTSSLDGRLGTGSPLTVTLSVGTHIVTLRAYDDEGASGQAFVSVDIVAPPLVTITAPSDGSAFGTGETVSFEGSANDPDGGVIDSLIWESNLDDRLGTGSPVMRSDLSVGTHTIWLIAVDDEAQRDSVSIEITIVSSALQFDGAQSTETPDADDLDLTTAFTIEMWIKPSNVTAWLQHLVSKWGCCDIASYHVAITNEFGMDRLIQVGTRDNYSGPNTFAYSNTSLENGVWQHVAAVFDNGEVRIYVNGELDATQTGMVVPQVGPTPVSLARQNSPDGYKGKYYYGIMDEVRIWNVARTAGEIAANMNVRLIGSEAGLVAFWPMDEGSGDTALDLTGRGHDMQLGDVTGPDAADPTWVSPGKL